jgi:hypothetical protein
MTFPKHCPLVHGPISRLVYQYTTTSDSPEVLQARFQPASPSSETYSIGRKTNFLLNMLFYDLIFMLQDYENI